MSRVRNPRFPVPLPRLSACLLTGMMAALLLATGCGPDADKQGRPPIPVLTATAEAKPALVTMDAVGTVQASQSVDVKSRVDGHIIKIHFLDGADVRAGDVLFTIDPGTLAFSHDEAMAELAAQRAKAARAAKELERYQELYGKGVVSKDEFELKQAETTVTLDTLKASLASSAQAGKQLDFTTITSPVDGKAGNARLDIGSLVEENTDVLVTIKNLSQVKVEFALPERALDTVRAHAESGQLTVLASPLDGVPDGHGPEPARGTLVFYDNWINPKTGMFALQAVFDNQDFRLWPGQYVTASLILDTLESAVHVPVVALAMGDQGEYVWVVADNKAEPRPVTSLLYSGGEVVLSGGLAAGEEVVVDGQMKLSPGSLVVGKSGPENAPAKDAENTEDAGQ